MILVLRDKLCEYLLSCFSNLIDRSPVAISCLCNWTRMNSICYRGSVGREASSSWVISGGKFSSSAGGAPVRAAFMSMPKKL
jgi:hypothetical protein